MDAGRGAMSRGRGPRPGRRLNRAPYPNKPLDRPSTDRMPIPAIQALASCREVQTRRFTAGMASSGLRAEAMAVNVLYGYTVIKHLCPGLSRAPHDGGLLPWAQSPLLLARRWQSGLAQTPYSASACSTSWKPRSAAISCWRCSMPASTNSSTRPQCRQTR